MKSYVYQFIVALTVLFVSAAVEPLLYPVVMNWTPTKIVKEDQQVKLAGFMNKVRDCRFVAVTVEDNNHIRLPLKFLDNVDDDAINRPTGSQTWGQWTVQARPTTSSITFTAHHECHPLWITKTTLGSIHLFERE